MRLRNYSHKAIKAYKTVYVLLLEHRVATLFTKIGSLVNTSPSNGRECHSAKYLSSLLTIIIFLLLGCERDMVPLFQEAQPHWNNTRGPFLKTRWGQDGSYAAFSPKHEALGCWSVAFAQTLAYHRLPPKGEIVYNTHGGISINERLDSLVNWDRIVPSIGEERQANDTMQIAQYCYQAAVVVQKDFGRGEYMDISIVPREVSEHYRCRVDHVNTNIAERVKTEMLAGRPVVVYFNDILDIGIVRNGHAAVIDGYVEDQGRVMVHINFGWKGASDGWYDYAIVAKERDLQYIFTLVP